MLLLTVSEDLWRGERTLFFKETQIYNIICHTDTPETFDKDIADYVRDYNLRYIHDNEDLLEMNIFRTEYVEVDKIYLFDKTEADKKEQERMSKVVMLFNPTSKTNIFYERYMAYRDNQIITSIY